jgi:hypothetical protein
VFVDDSPLVVVVVVPVVEVLVEFDVDEGPDAPHLVGPSRDPSVSGGAVAVPARAPSLGQRFSPAPGATSVVLVVAVLVGVVVVVLVVVVVSLLEVSNPLSRRGGGACPYRHGGGLIT